MSKLERVLGEIFIFMFFSFGILAMLSYKTILLVFGLLISTYVTPISILVIVIAILFFPKGD